MLKRKVNNNAHLSYPKSDVGLFILEKDVSNIGIGAALSRQQDGPGWGRDNDKLCQWYFKCGRAELLFNKEGTFAVTYAVEHIKHYLYKQG